MDDAARYRALVARDRRFDGKFFVCVRTTGIYCRPVCPAPTPKLRNIEFRSCAAAAEAAGFRPCLRCRPETAPGSAAWLGASSTVLRAFRLIEAGALDDGSVETLAARLGMGSRHLRRLFLDHVGASPAAVAQTRRVQLAKRLLDDTTLPIARVAFDAGFSSVRRFNEAMRITYGRAPRELRRRGSRPRGCAAECEPDDAGAERTLVLRLAYRGPFAWDDMLAFFAARAIPGTEEIAARTYRRRVRYGDTHGIVVVSQDATASCLRVAVPAALSPGIAPLLAAVRRAFDLDADPTTITTALASDPRLRPWLSKRPGLRVPGAWDPLEIVVRAVSGQQISVQAATVMCGRLVERFGTRVADEALPFVFPSAAVLAHAALEQAGLTRAKANAIRTVARAVLAGELSLDGTEPCASVLQRLQAIPGIGPWTAGYIAMRTLGEPDAFPVGDLGLCRALGNGQQRISAHELLARSASWRPWRAYATLHAWLGERDSHARERNDQEDRHAPQARRDRHAVRQHLVGER